MSPYADALTVAVPKPTPKTRGNPYGAVKPAGIYTLCGLTVTFEVSLLESVTVTPPGGAASVKNIGSEASPPGATFKPEANVISAANTVEAEAHKSRRAVKE
jgi:hypothetical protein